MNPNLDQFDVSRAGRAELVELWVHYEPEPRPVRGIRGARPRPPRRRLACLHGREPEIYAHYRRLSPVRGGLDFEPRRLLEAWGANRPLPVSGIGRGAWPRGS